MEDCGSSRGRFRGDINVQVSVGEGRGGAGRCGVGHPLGLLQIYREARDVYKLYGYSNRSSYKQHRATECRGRAYS
jgi:hypothetical protein